MGMFDEVAIGANPLGRNHGRDLFPDRQPFVCPCGADVSRVEYQTKGLTNSMAQWLIEDEHIRCANAAHGIWESVSGHEWNKPEPIEVGMYSRCERGHWVSFSFDLVEVVADAAYRIVNFRAGPHDLNEDNARPSRIEHESSIGAADWIRAHAAKAPAA